MKLATTKRGRLLSVGAFVTAAAMMFAACSSDEPAAEDVVVVDPVEGGGAGGSINILIGSSGPAETQTVTAQVAQCSAETGVQGTVITSTDQTQELSQGFAAGNPADLFYLPQDQLANWAAAGNLWAYGDQLGEFSFYPALVDAFTYDGTFYAAPKDFSTLALAINEDQWAAAGLTDADIPTTWDQLEHVAQELTRDGHVGLSFGPEWQRIGVFMAQAGGGLLDANGHAAVDTPENLAALEFVQRGLQEGWIAYPSAIDSGWGGEAFGSGRAAMTIEGNWLMGAMANDFPNVDFKVVPLPTGPNGGQGTLMFTTGWGIAQASSNHQGALAMVKCLLSDEQQMAAAEGFGVMPATTTVADEWAAAFPEQAAFIGGGNYAQTFPAIQGIAPVIGDFGSQLEGLSNANAHSILTSVQGSLADITN